MTTNITPESLSSRAQVIKDTKLKKLKDMLLVAGLVIVCLVIGLSSLLPKHKAKGVLEESDKENTSVQLNQNLALIAALREKSKSSTPEVSSIKYPKLRKAHKVTLTKETLARMNAPSTFFSISAGESSPATKISKQGKNRALIGHDENSEFLNQQNDITAVSAKRIPHPSMTVPAGEMIPATIETAINSELAGMVRAITSRDIYSLSGEKLLIPKGSTIVGQFNTSLSQGQSRIFVVWNRLQMPNGIIVTLNSPSSDSLGRSGQAADYVDRHFFERFASGALLSVLGAYTAIGGVQGQDEYNSMSQYRMNVAGSFQQAANQTLQQDMRTKPTLQVNQGTSINVFVAHDLDFYRVGRN